MADDTTVYVAVDKWQREYLVPGAESLREAQDRACAALGPHGYGMVRELASRRFQYELLPESEPTAAVWESLHTDDPDDQVLDLGGRCTVEVGPAWPSGWSCTVVHRDDHDVLSEAVSSHPDEAAAKAHGETVPRCEPHESD